jgi:hypothetical protein
MPCTTPPESDRSHLSTGPIHFPLATHSGRANNAGMSESLRLMTAQRDLVNNVC